MNKKLSPAQQRAVGIIGQNPVVTDRRSVLIKYASRKYDPTGIKMQTIEALIRLELVTVHPADQDGDQAIKLLTTPEAQEAPEAQVATAEVEAPEAQVATPEAEAPNSAAPEPAPTTPAPTPEATEVEATEDPETATETITAVWPAKGMSKYGYAVVRVTDNTEHATGHTCYRVLDYKSASLVGLYGPTTVCSHRTISAAIAAAEEFEQIDIGMSRAWRACKIRMARLGLRKSKGVQTKAPTTPALKAAEVPEVSRTEILAETEAITRYLIDTSADDKLHRHNLGRVFLLQGKMEEAKRVFLALYESYRHDSRLQEAKQPLWEIIINCPDYAPVAYTLLGKTCEDLQQYPDAIAAYTDAITYKGVCEDYLYGLHRAYLAMGDSVQAAEYLEQARVLADEREIAMGRCIPVPARVLFEARQDERHKGE